MTGLANMVMKTNMAHAKMLVNKSVKPSRKTMSLTKNSPMKVNQSSCLSMSPKILVATDRSTPTTTVNALS